MKSESQNGPITKESSFDRLMRGLIAVPKEELEAEIAKDGRKKAQSGKAKKPKPKK